jgi:hypothetical protein
MKNFNNYGKCNHCGWMCEFIESHIEYAFSSGSWDENNKGCKYIKKRYHISYDDDGDIIFTKKDKKPLKKQNN